MGTTHQVAHLSGIQRKVFGHISRNQPGMKAVVEAAWGCPMVPAVGGQWMSIRAEFTEPINLSGRPVPSGYDQQHDGRHPELPQPIQLRLDAIHRFGHKVVNAD
jgi:hypothetical protein